MRTHNTHSHMYILVSHLTFTTEESSGFQTKSILANNKEQDAHVYNS